MREADFTTVFCGIETPEAEALDAHAQGAQRGAADPRRGRTLNGYGMEVVSGIILGLDTDTAETEARLKLSSTRRRSRC